MTALKKSNFTGVNWNQYRVFNPQGIRHCDIVKGLEQWDQELCPLAWEPPQTKKLPLPPLFQVLPEWHQWLPARRSTRGTFLQWHPKKWCLPHPGREISMLFIPQIPTVTWGQTWEQGLGSSLSLSVTETQSLAHLPCWSCALPSGSNSDVMWSVV